MPAIFSKLSIKSGSLKKRKILFCRDFQVYTGGHQKVFDYFSHVQHHNHYLPSISFSNNTVWDITNPWYPAYKDKSVTFSPNDYYGLFLAGMDWRALLKKEISFEKPILNLIQHVRHADPSQDVYQFLHQKAIRICVSEEVTDAICSTGKVNGPVFTIPNGLDIPIEADIEKCWDYLIVGRKQPHLSRHLAQKLQGENLLLLDTYVPRIELLEKMAASRIVILLPNPSEGFYLPALEAMKLAEIAVVPDCVGNRSFCIDSVNCLRPDYDVDAILTAALSAKSLLAKPLQLKALKQSASKTLHSHTIESERQQFYDVLNNIGQIW